jgi:hypothetical protein
MDLLSIIQATWRHKLAALPVILLTMLGVYYVVAVKPSVYQASASFLLLAPPGPPTPEQVAANPKLGKVSANNPYVNLGLPVAADAVLNVVTSNATALQLDNEGVSPNYQATLSTDFGSPPIIQVTGVGTTAAQAIRGADLVTLAAKNALAQLQKNQGVNNQYMITSTNLVEPTHATLSVSGKLRTLIAVLGLGAVLLFVVVSVTDVVEKRRKGREFTADPPISVRESREEVRRRPLPSASAAAPGLAAGPPKTPVRGSPKNGARSGWQHYPEPRPGQPGRRPLVRPDDRA